MSLRQREESHDRPLRILSVDGGGAKGLNAIIVLKALERECGQPLNEMFDYIAGTSIGGAIANSVAKEAYSLDKAEDFIEQVCTSAPLPSPLPPSAQAASHFFSPLTPFRYPPLLCGRQVVYKPGSLNGGEALFKRASIWSLLSKHSMMEADHFDQLLEETVTKLYGLNRDEIMPPPTSEAKNSVLAAAAGVAAADASITSDAAIDGRARPVTPHSMTLTSTLRPNGTFEPVVCTNYGRDGPQFSGVAGHVDWTIHDCLRSTSAVPILWPPYRVEGREYFGEPVPYPCHHNRALWGL